MTTFGRPTDISPTDRAVPPSMVDRMTVISTPRRFLLTGAAEELARRPLPRSTVHRILDSLLRLAGGAFPRRLPHRAAPAPTRRRGGDTTARSRRPRRRRSTTCTPHGLVVHLGVLDGTDLLYLDRSVPRPTRRRMFVSGGRVPAHATAAGKAILASLSPSRSTRSTPARRCGLHRSDRSRICPALHRDLSRVRTRRGVAVRPRRVDDRRDVRGGNRSGWTAGLSPRCPAVRRFRGRPRGRAMRAARFSRPDGSWATLSPHRCSCSPPDLAGPTPLLRNVVNGSAADRSSDRLTLGITGRPDPSVAGALSDERRDSETILETEESPPRNDDAADSCGGVDFRGGWPCSSLRQSRFRPPSTVADAARQAGHRADDRPEHRYVDVDGHRMSVAVQGSDHGPSS